jgi:hypothetical protein
MKRPKIFVSIALIFTSLFLLSACGSSPTTDTTTGTPTTTGTTNVADDLAKQGKILYQGTDFTIAIPDRWEVISKDDFTSNFPAETAVAFRNNVKNEIFTANITISVQPLEVDIPAEDFGKNSIKKQKEYILDFKDTRNSVQDLTYQNGKIKTYFVQSEGKKSAIDPLVKFAQLFIVNNKKAYTITAAYLPNEDENVVNAINEMINSFALK